jgi:hypothetical protein
VASYRSGLLTPPREEEERRVRRPVWRSLFVENAALAAVVVGLFIAQAFVGLPIPARLRIPLNLVIALLPVALWLILSVSAENAYPQPRQRLVAVAVLAGLSRAPSDSRCWMISYKSNHGCRSRRRSAVSSDIR